MPEQAATPVQQPGPLVKKEAECISLLAEMYRRGGFVFSSSGSDESVGAYCTRKVETLSPDKVQPEIAESRLPPKASYSDAICLAPVGQSVGMSAQAEDPTVDDLALTTPPLHPNIQSLGQGSKFPKSKVNIETPTVEFAFAPAHEHRVLSGASASGHADSPSNVMSGGEEFMSTGEIEGLTNTDLESEHYKRSTFADAIAAPVHNFAPRFSEGSECVYPDEAIQRSGGPAPLSIHSQELIRTYFEKAHSFSLPQGHPTISLNQEQIGHILRIVADETARASFEMLNSVVTRASQLSIRDSPTMRKTQMHRPMSVRSCTSGSEGDLTSFGTDDIGRDIDSRGATSGGDFWGDEDGGNCSSRLSGIEVPSPPAPGSNRIDLNGTLNSGACGSPGNQTLAELKQEATKAKNKGRKRQPPKSKAKNPRRVVTRSSKILRDELLDGMAWARTFVSGPMDPRWNPYKFYCQICKGNVSIYGRGVKEILRHHSTERHLRKDQRWQYEHLAVEDPQTKVVHHQVRDGKGQLLSPNDLQKEYKYFKDAVLVDIGEKLPYYHEAMSGNTHMTASSENRVRVQISILRHFLPSVGDLGLLRGLWKDVGVVVNHQALFSDFNWVKVRLSVSLLGYF